jgi:hypothetical protein
MKNHVVRILLIVAPLVSAGGLLYARSVAQTSPAASGVGAALISQPAEWVPFSAQLEKTTGGGERFAGRYFQGRDGSTRYDTGPGPVLTEVTAVGIKNIRLQKFYSFSRRSGWTEQPMQLPPGGWHPAPTLASIFTATDDTLEGLPLLKRISATTETWVAPDLNLFAVRIDIHDCGALGQTCWTRFFNIRREEQDDQLFELPSDAVSVTQLSVPGGIVRN